MQWDTLAQINRTPLSEMPSTGQACAMTLKQPMFLPALIANKTRPVQHVCVAHFTLYPSPTNDAMPLQWTLLAHSPKTMDTTAYSLSQTGWAQTFKLFLQPVHSRLKDSPKSSLTNGTAKMVCPPKLSLIVTNSSCLISGKRYTN
jgi:hypothetical protein